MILRKTLLLFIFFSIINISASEAQSKRITTFYDNDSSLVKEQYYILQSDTLAKDQLYLKFSKDGNLLQKGFYEEGEKIGEWVRFLENRKIESSGYYNSEGQFNGCSFSYNSDSELEQVDYYDNGIANNDSLQLQFELIKNLSAALRNQGFDSYPTMVENFNIFNINISKYDSIENNEEKLVFGNRLICDGYFYKEWFNFYTDEYKLIENLKPEIDDFSPKIDTEYLNYLLDPLKQQTDSLLKTNNIAYVLDEGKILRNDFKLISKNLIEIERIEQQIFASTQELENKHKLEMPEFYESEIKIFRKKENEYKLEKNHETKVLLVNELLLLINKMSEDFEKLTNIISSIDIKKEKLKRTYEEKFPVDFSVLEKGINKDFEIFQTSTELQEKIKLGENILSYIQISSVEFFTIDSMDIIISEEYTPLKEGYFQTFPAIYAKEIKPIASNITEFGRTKGLKLKIESGNKIIDTLHYYKNTYQILSEVELALNEKYKTLQTNFKENYRTIYKTELSKLNDIIKKYNTNNRSKSKLDAAIILMEKINQLEENYTKMNQQKENINTRFTEIAEKYKSDFLPIYKNTVRQFENKKDANKKATNCKSYLEKGNSFLDEVSNLEEKHEQLSEQFAQIQENLSKVENLYQMDFPEIFDGEIKDEKAKIKEYNNASFIEKKLKTGDFIIGKLKTIQDAHQQLKLDNTKISNEFSSLVDDYKMGLPALYRTYITKLKDLEKDYRQTGYHATKLSLGSTVTENLDKYRKNFELFNTQNEIILNKYDEFKYNYEGRKEVKKMYKKGKWAYTELKKAYDNETNFEEKEKNGNNIELMLKQFISLSSRDNSILNDELRSAKTVDEVLKTIGVN